MTETAASECGIRGRRIEEPKSKPFPDTTQAGQAAFNGKPLIGRINAMRIVESCAIADIITVAHDDKKSTVVTLIHMRKALWYSSRYRRTEARFCSYRTPRLLLRELVLFHELEVPDRSSYPDTAPSCGLQNIPTSRSRQRLGNMNASKSVRHGLHEQDCQMRSAQGNR